MRVAIIGSCVTRDSLELLESNEVELVAYYARSSLASACSDRKFLDVDTSTIESAFQRRIVGYDLEKTFLMFVKTGEFDLLFYDPIDERFDLLRNDGALATRSNEYLRAEGPDGPEQIRSGSTEFYELWERGWERLIAELDAAGKRDRFRVNAAFWADAHESGDDAAPGSASSTAEANKFLSKLYERMAIDVPAEQFYRYHDEHLVSAEQHKWGPGPFHYVESFYRHFVSMLRVDCDQGNRASQTEFRLETHSEVPSLSPETLETASDETPVENRVHTFRTRHVVYSVRPRPSSRRLVFIFSGLDSTPGATRMSYFGFGSAIDATVVHVKDGSGAHGTYLLSVGGDEQIRNAVLSLVRSLQDEFSVPIERTWLVGTSKGGTSAICYGLMLGGGHVIAGEPQVRLGAFLSAPNSEGELVEWQRSIRYAMLGRVHESDIDTLDDLVPGLARRYGSRFKGTIRILIGETKYYENHVVPLLEAMGSVRSTQSVTVERYSFPEHSQVVAPFLWSLFHRLGPPPA